MSYIDNLMTLLLDDAIAYTHNCARDDKKYIDESGVENRDNDCQTAKDSFTKYLQILRHARLSCHDTRSTLACAVVSQKCPIV